MKDILFNILSLMTIHNSWSWQVAVSVSYQHKKAEHN